MNPRVIEHNSSDEQRHCAQRDHANGYPLVSELLIKPSRFFNRLSWFSKTKNALDECSETDNQHANASNHGVQISGLLDHIHIAY
ncbi:hypothetical protein [Brucella tritici]|uniref:hypothetical protein n=1 Tax=Brucella tritici TaxID=94626 RepID=UPI00178C4A3F|nr:hypothetical protein [Brucella tritici]